MGGNIKMTTKAINLSKLGLDYENLRVLQYLITTQEEYKDFEENYWKGEKRQFFAVAKYRLHRITQRNMSSKEFLSIFANNNEEALSELFMQQIEKDITNAIINSINNGTLTVESIYTKFNQDKGLNVARLSHSRRLVRK